MQVDNPKAAKLYTNLINDGYTSKNLGSIDEFSAALSDPTKADKIYNGLIGDGYTQANLGSQKEFMQTFTQPGFSAKINQGAPQKPLPINTEQPQQPEPVQLQAPNVDNNFGLPSHNQLAQPVQSDNTNNIAPKEAIQAEVNQANIPVWNKQKADYKEKVIKSTPDAITNAAVKSLKIQGIDPSNAAQLNKEKQKFQDQVTNGNATVSFDKDGTPGLVQNPGFFSSLWDHLKGGVTGWYDARKFKDMSVDERVNYANSLQKQQSPYIGVKPTDAGSVGALAGDVAPTVGRYAAGAAAGVGLEALAPETGGLSNLALKPIMSFVTNAGVEADLSGMNGTLQRYYDLKSKNPDKSDKELMQEAAKGEDVDRLAGIGNAALFSTTGNVLGKSVTSSFIKDAVKTGADIGAKTAIVEGAKDIGHNVEGVTNKSASDIAKDMGEAFAENAPMGTLLHAFMGTITGLAKVPPLIKSGLKYDIINKMTPDEVRSELTKNVQSGAITPVEAQTAEAKLNEYGQALQTVPPYLSDEAKASVAGLIIKRNNLLKQSEGLDKTAQDLVNPEVDAINNQIKEVYRTGKVEQVEINPTTGETYQKPEYDNIAQQRVQDLAQRIASGKTITKPEDIKTQADFPDELKAELQNHLKEDQKAGKEGTGVQENINEYLKQNDVSRETNDISNKETNNLAENKPEDKSAEPVSSPIISDAKGDNTSINKDVEHADNIKTKFRETFKDKGNSDEHIDASIALMDARAKSWASEEKGRTPEQWFQQIADVKNGEFQTNDVKYQGSKLKSAILGAASMLHSVDINNSHQINKVGEKPSINSDINNDYSTISIKDIRNKDAVTGSRVKDNNNLSEKEVSVYSVRNIVRAANKDGIDPFTALAVAYQETHLSIDEEANPFHVLMTDAVLDESNSSKKTMPQIGVDLLKKKFELANRLGKKSEAEKLQAFNGYGKVGKHTENSGDRIYGIDVSKKPIDMNKTPVYGERIIDVRDNILKKNPELVKIVNEEKGNIAYQEESGIRHGAVETLKDGRVIIHALEAPDVSTMVHEIAHVFEKDLTDAEKKVMGDSETFARGFERYLRDGEAPTAELKTLFDKFKVWLTNIYQSLKGSPISKKVSPELKQIFDRLLTDDSKTPEENNSENNKKEVPSNNESSDKIQNPSTIEDEAKDAEDSGDPVKAANTIKSIDAAIKSSPDQQARDNGEKTVDGRTVKRQKKVKAVIGKPVDLLFSKDEKQPAKYAVIEREDLQPSHKSGIKNENHFIPEAQPRDRGSMEVLKNEAKKKSDNLDPSQLAENNIAYFGSPIVNERGEVIQGNGRAEAIDYYYGDNKNDSKGYRKMIESKADELGLDKDEIAKMKEPVLVRMADVNDERAIILGNHTSSDLEDVKQKGADAKAGIGKLKQSDLAQLSNLVSSQIGEAGTLKGSIRDNAKPIIDLLMDKGILRGDNREMYFNKDGVTPEGVDAAYNMVKQLLFEGGGSDLQGKFDNLPFTQREAIEKTIPAILNHSELKNHIQKVIEILHEKNESGNKNFSTWERQIDMFNGKNPSDIYSGEDLGLASKIDGAKTQKEISTVIKQLSSDMNDKAADMFEPARKGLIFKDALRKSGVDFNEPVKLNKSEERIAKEQIKKSDAQQIIDNEGLTLENLNDYKHLFKGFPFTPEDFKNIKNELNDTKSSSTEPTTAGQESAGNVSNKESGNEAQIQSEPNKNSESGQIKNTKPTGTKSAGDVQPENAKPEISRAGIPVPFAQEFIDNDVTPRLEKIGGTFKDALRSIVNTLSPKTGVSEKAITHLMRALGERNAASAEVDKVLSGLEKAFDKMKDEDRVSFIDKMKRGEKQDSPELDAVAGTLKSLDKDLYDAIAEYKPSITWKDNHFRVLWKVIPGSEKSKFWSNLTRRPLQGSKGFFKQATLADMSEGIEKGGVPQTTNPIRMFKLAYADGMKFVTANRMFEALKKDKMVQFVKTGERAPDFFVPINDNIAKVYFKADAGLVKAGEYYIEEGAGRLLNNHLSRDLIREHSVGKGLMEIKNLYTQVELGLSGFHAIAEGLETVSSDLGLGFRKLFNMGIRGDFKMAGEGIMDILKAPFSPKTTFTMGRNVIRFATEKEFENSDFGKAWLKKMPDAKQYITDFFNGGGLLKQSEDLRANTFQSLKEQAGKDNYIGAALRALPAMNEAILSPLFNHYIPALKVGMFFKEFPVTLKENEARLQKGTTTRDELARKTINFIDDRLGEMNFDNLFWNRTFKTATQFMMRSVTWKIGNLRAMLGSVPEQAQEFINAAKEKRAPLLMPKTAWIFGLSAMQIALSTVIMKIFANKHPQNFKDIVAPQINPDDEKDRVIMPTYYKDMLHLWHSKLGYVTTSMSGPFSKMIDIWNNKDFYNYEIHDEHDSFLQKRKDDVLYFVPKPFSITSAAQQLESGDGGKAVMSFFGLNKAPGYLTNSDIENEIFDLYNVRNTNVKPKAEKEGNDIKKQIRELYKDDKRQEAQAMADKAVKDGILRPTQIKYLFSHVGKEGSPAQFFFKELPYEDKKYLVGKMTDEEKKIYDPRGKFK